MDFSNSDGEEVLINSVLSRRISANTAVPGDAVWGGKTDGGVEHDGRAFGGQESEGTELLADEG